MAIHNVLINVSDVARSADFYTRLLGGKPVGEATTDGAVLDFVTATIELRRVDGAVPSTWHEDDQYLGFRHVGFKVAQVDPLAAELRAAGVPFRLEPVDAVGEVRIAFFFDPDGTVLEIVEGQLQYHDIVDRDGVAVAPALRPRGGHHPRPGRHRRPVPVPRLPQYRHAVLPGRPARVPDLSLIH